MTSVLARAWFPGSSSYWRWRYALHGSSGAGSYGPEAQFKADYVNRFVRDHEIQSVIEFGCGDGAQLRLLDLPRYLGIDVSGAAVKRCRRIFVGDSSRRFATVDEYRNERADLALSLDVVYHLVEDDAFEHYMHRLFGAAKRYVVIYSTDHQDAIAGGASHVRHRSVAHWVRTFQTEWTPSGTSACASANARSGPMFMAFALQASRA